MNVLLVSAVALIDADGRVLLAQRPEGKSMAGLWEFPGGKVEAGETPEAALIRELEDKIKRDFYDYLVTGHRGFRYEWITEDVAFDQIVQYVEWEITQLDGIEPVVSGH